MVAKGLSRAGVRMHRQKTKFRPKSKLVISPATARQEVTGLVVNGDRGVSLSHERRDVIRCAIHDLRHITDSVERENALASVRGRIAHVKQFNPGTAKRLSHQLGRILAQKPTPRRSI